MKEWLLLYLGHEEGCGEWRNHAPYLFFQPVLGTHAPWASKTQMTFHFSMPIQHLVAQSSLFCCSHGSHSCHSHPLPWWALSLSLSLSMWHKEKQDSVAFYVSLGILLLCHKNLGKLLQNTHSKKSRTEPFCVELLLMTHKNMGKCFTFIDSKFSIVSVPIESSLQRLRICKEMD